MLVALVLINWLVYASVGGLVAAGEQLRGDCKSWAPSKSTWIYYKFIKMVLGSWFCTCSYALNACITEVIMELEDCFLEKKTLP